MALDSATHSSLIQGISQQADISRGTASAEDQENCLNEVLDGVVSRMGSKVEAAIVASYTDPYIHEIIRSDTEKYLVIIENGVIRILNRVDGQEATLTGDIAAYLSHTGIARKAFQAVTVGDTTFLLNRQKQVAMGTTKSPARANYGCFYVRAGGYLLTYKVTIVIGSSSYTASFTTPDNSASGNARYIATDYIADQFRDALNSTVIPDIAGDGHGTFTATRYGSTIVLTAPAGLEFDLRTSDGVGDTHMKSFVDSAKTVSDLPARCRSGYQVAIAPNGGSNREKYYLKYSGGTDTGRWEESVKWDTVLGLDASTMPHVLVNTGLNAFEVKQTNWGTRVAGDGDYTSVDPSFVGYPIRSIQFLSGRLAAISEFNTTLSRSRNAFVFFPDTAQTTLGTDPIDYDVSNGSSTLIEYGVVAGGKLQFWGNNQQTYLDSGQDSIKEETTEVLPLANYEYDGGYPPKPVGMSSIMFATAIGRWSKVTEIFLRNGLPQGEIAITAHVPKLLDGSTRCIAPGEAAGKTFFLTSREANLAYLYQWYNQGQDRVQSAWNKWSFAAPSSILWASVEGDIAYFLFQWNGVVTLESVKLDATGDEEEERFPIRLDHRVDENSAVFIDDHFLLTLPYPVPEAKRASFVCYERQDVPDISQRGKEVALEWLTDTSVKVLCGDITRKFFFGVIPVSRRRPSRFYARDRQDQPVIHDKLLMKWVRISHKDTVEYDLLVYKQDGTVVRQTFNGRVIGDPTVTNDQVPIKTGSFKADINAEAEDADIELVNATPFPCTWTAMKYVYELTLKTA